MPARDSSVDWLRGVLIVGVLLVHADLLFETQPNTMLNYGYAVVGPVLMPTVLALSGYLTNRRGDGSFLGFVGARGRRLLWPYLVWCAIYAPFLLYVEDKFVSWFTVVKYAFTDPSELGPVWFLAYLFVFSVVVRAVRTIPAWFLLMVTVGAGLLLFAVVGGGPSAVVHFCGFLTGLMFRESPGVLDALPRAAWRSLAVLTVTLLFLLPLVHGDGNRDSVVAAPLVAAGCAIALRYRHKLHALFGSAWFEHVGANPLNYYLPHWPVMLLVHSTVGAERSQPMTFLSFLLGLGLSIIIGELLSRRLASVPAVDVLFNYPRQTA